MGVPNGRRTIGMMAGIALAALGLSSPIAEAQVARCVGTQVSPCTEPNTYDSWPEAHRAANRGDTIILTNGDLKTILRDPTEPGPQDLTARLTVGKRLIVKTYTGSATMGAVVLSDANMDLAPTDYIVHVVSGGEGTDLRVKVRVTANSNGVPRSAGGIFLEVDSDVLVGSSVEGPGKTLGIKPSSDNGNGIRLPSGQVATIGIRVNRGTGSKTMRVLGLSSDPTRVTGFGVGIFVDNPSFHVTSYVRAEHNRIGLLQRWGRGQNFYGTWINNDIAIEMQGVNHNDTNSHTFKCNGVALRSSWADQANPVTTNQVNGPHLEYNWHVVDTSPCPDSSPGAPPRALKPGERGRDVEVEVVPGTPFALDRRLDPGYYIQYGSRKVDGITLPTYITPGPN